MILIFLESGDHFRSNGVSHCPLTTVVFVLTLFPIFGLRKFGQIEPFLDSNEADVDICTENRKNNFGSMQNVLALIIIVFC